MARVVSGIQPSGTLHIGNYVGAIRQFVELQSKYECFFFVADLHALTEPYNPKEYPKRILDLVATYLAAGLDPKKCVLFRQSHVPEHVELGWLLNTIASMGQLERMTQYKEKSAQAKGGVNVGLFDYPVLMAADILIYKPDFVPVGEDQKQHVEITRDLAERFNSRFGKTFPLPKPLFTSGARVMALNDPTKKMSKSIPGSFVALTDDEKTTREKVMAAVTDTKPGKEMSPGVKNLFTLVEIFSPKETYARLKSDYDKGSLKYEELKKTLASDLNRSFEPIRKKYSELIKKPDYLNEILESGATKARPIAQKTLAEVKEKMGLA
jgi:tryptophanyl-tRNA synthetase